MTAENKSGPNILIQTLGKFGDFTFNIIDWLSKRIPTSSERFSPDVDDPLIKTEPLRNQSNDDTLA